MNIEQKAKLLNGKDVWHTVDIPNENIPSIMMTDGPIGLRKQVDVNDNLGLNNSYPATLFPSSSAVACSFNKDVARKMGEAIGREARANDVQMVLGPGINIKRNPLCGRNFEYFSEDPYLAGTMGYNWIEGLQSQNIGASLKHYAANNQETFRLTSDSIVDERALRELYLKNFEIAIKANPATVMCSYNKINGTYASENKYLLTDILRNQWNYKGLVVSDWGAVSNRVKGLISGLDLEMPSSNGYNTERIVEAYNQNKITEDDINVASDRVINLVNKYKDNKIIPLNVEENHRVAQEIARESIVLLKNEDEILPLKKENRIAIVGKFAKQPHIQGGGSAFINPYKIENVLNSINNYTTNYEYFDGYELEGDGYSEEKINEILKEAQNFDKIIIMTGLPDSYETEGFDRKNMDLPLGHLKLIDAILDINKNVIITLYAGSPVTLPFVNKVKAIVNCNLLGAASGVPLLDNLYGNVSPSGRLATTFPYRLEDDPTTSNFADGNNAVWYQESIYVGYRYYSTYNKEVLYPFGFGLSYSSFEYSSLVVDRSRIEKDKTITVKINVKNTGKYPAKEVIQLYIENNKSSVYKPLRELRKYEKIFLNPNEEREVTFTLDFNDFTYYDIYMKKFTVNKGIYKIQICKNVNEVILEKEIIKEKEEQGFIVHPENNYNKEEFIITKEDFENLIGKELPEKQIKRKRPYNLDATLADVERTLIGRLLKKIAINQATKLNKDNSSEWMNVVIKKTLSETPLRSLAIMSGGYISLRKMEGIVDIINNRFIRGIRKL